MTTARLSRRAFLSGRSRPALSSRLGPHDAVTASQDADCLRARIDPARCLAAASQICTVCLERCGARGAVQMHGLYPRVLVDRCTGCGDCARACPAPVTAIQLTPRKETP